jgi:TRAP-type C4-dicarboxylate transport system permease small subunit
MDDAARGRGPVDRFIDLIELTAAGFLAVVTLLTFVSVILRYFFSWAIPDSYDITRLLLGILIFWGMAVASYRGDHITVDLLWSAVPASAQRAMDVFSALVTLIAMGTFTWMFAEKVLDIRAAGTGTFDLREPVWIYYFIAWIGLASSILLLVARTVRLVFWPQKLTSARRIADPLNNLSEGV